MLLEAGGGYLGIDKVTKTTIESFLTFVTYTIEKRELEFNNIKK